MKFLIAVLVVVAAFVLFGWMSFSTTDDSAGVTVETQKMVSDTEEFVEQTTDAIDGAVNEFDDDTADSVNDDDVAETVGSDG